MAQPNVIITRSNGNLNRVQPTADNVFGMMLTGAAEGNIALGVPKLLTGMTSFAALNVTTGNNALLVDEVTAFYSKAPDGTNLIVMIISDATLLATACDKTSGVIKTLIDFDQRISVVFVNKILPVGYTISLTAGLDADVINTNTKLQELCEYYDTRNRYLCTVQPGIGFLIANIATLRDNNTVTKNRVNILLAADESSGKAAIGLYAGWLAKNSYWHNPARVASGAVADAGWLVDGTKADAAGSINIQDTLFDKRYTYFRQFPQKSGFFFSDDPTTTAVSDDYSSVSWNRVINKAAAIAYLILLEKLNDDVPADPISGGIAKSLAADWESDVERAITQQMITAGAITAVKCTVNTTDSNLQTDQVKSTLRIVRNGQAKTIIVDIGFAL